MRPTSDRIGNSLPWLPLSGSRTVATSLEDITSMLADGSGPQGHRIGYMRGECFPPMHPGGRLIAETDALAHRRWKTIYNNDWVEAERERERRLIAERAAWDKEEQDDWPI